MTLAPLFRTGCPVVLKPRNAEQDQADASKKNSCYQADQSKGREKIAALVARERPGAGVEHQPTKSCGNRRFETA